LLHQVNVSLAFLYSVCFLVPGTLGFELRCNCALDNYSSFFDNLNNFGFVFNYGYN